MRQSYEQNIDQNYKPELTYEECLRIVKGLEAVRRCHLINSSIVEKAARLMQHNRIHNLPALNHFIEDIAAKGLNYTEQSSEIAEHPKPVTPADSTKRHRDEYYSSGCDSLTPMPRLPGPP